MARPFDDILSELGWGRGYFPEEALHAALERGEQIVPHRIAAVERAAKEPDDVPASYVLHASALFLHAEMRERRACRPIVDLCRLTDERLYDLISDVPTEGLRRILAVVAPGDDSLLREVVEDEGVSPAVRVAALHVRVRALDVRAWWEGGMASAVIGLVAALLAAWVFVFVTEYGRRVWNQQLKECLYIVRRQWGKSYAMEKVEAIQFWREARLFGALLGMLIACAATAGFVTLGVSEAVFVVPAIVWGTFRLVLVWAKKRLYRSRVQGGWG